MSSDASGRLPVVGDVVDGRWELRRVVGRGGMGIVMAAYDREASKEVAVKLIRPLRLKDSRARRRFQREMAVLQRLEHPNIVKLISHGEHGGVPFVVMDLVDGRTLKDVLITEGPLHPSRATEIARQIADALTAVHRAQVVHRDLKPANIVLDERTDPPRAQVLDFGIAKTLTAGDTPLTKTGHLVGTSGYVAPELILGTGDATPASDVYACGVILLGMLLGEKIFDDPSPMASLVMQVKVGVRLPPELESTRLGEVIQRATAISPSARFPHSVRLLQALTEVLPHAETYPRMDRERASEFLNSTYSRAGALDDFLSVLGQDPPDRAQKRLRETLRVEGPPLADTAPPPADDSMSFIDQPTMRLADEAQAKLRAADQSADLRNRIDPARDNDTVRSVAPINITVPDRRPAGQFEPTPPSTTGTDPETRPITPPPNHGPPHSSPAPQPQVEPKDPIPVEPADGEEPAVTEPEFDPTGKMDRDQPRVGSRKHEPPAEMATTLPAAPPVGMQEPNDDDPTTNNQRSSTIRDAEEVLAQRRLATETKTGPSLTPHPAPRSSVPALSWPVLLLGMALLCVFGFGLGVVLAPSADTKASGPAPETLAVRVGPKLTMSYKSDGTLVRALDKDAVPVAAYGAVVVEPGSITPPAGKLYVVDLFEAGDDGRTVAILMTAAEHDAILTELANARELAQASSSSATAVAERAGW